MTSTELLAAFRDEVADTVLPYLWSDATVYRYIDDAQKMFCRRTEGIEDSRTAAVTQLAVVPNTEWYPTSKLILKIRSVTRNDTGRSVEVVNVERAPERGIYFDGRKGPIRALVAGLDKSALRAWPIPNETVTLSMSVFRLPLEAIADEGDQDLEVDEQHHQALLLWAKHLAYNKQDAETADPNRAADYEQRFYAYCAAARIEQERARRVVGTVAYGGI